MTSRIDIIGQNGNDGLHYSEAPKENKMSNDLYPTAKPLVIYHDKCADGFGAAFAAWLKFGDEAEYLPFQYNQEHPDIQDVEGREIYVLDFSFPKATMETLFATAKRVVWLDHHKTAFEMWCGEYYKGIKYDDPCTPHSIYLDDGMSGAMIAWKYFHPDKEVPLLIKHIDDYDRWQFKIGGTKEFNKALWSYAPWSFERWKELNNFFSDHNGKMYLEQFYAEGKAILRAHEQNVQAVVEGAEMECILYVPNGLIGRAGLAANCPPHLASDAGHQLANKSGTYGLLWYINKEGKCLCSLRSNGDYDVSVIAKAFGGGGHKNAAGFEVPVETLLGWMK